jgi:hypothetical protein
MIHVDLPARPFVRYLVHDDPRQVDGRVQDHAASPQRPSSKEVVSVRAESLAQVVAEASRPELERRARRVTLDESSPSYVAIRSLEDYMMDENVRALGLDRARAALLKAPGLSREFEAALSIAVMRTIAEVNGSRLAALSEELIERGLHDDDRIREDLIDIAIRQLGIDQDHLNEAIDAAQIKLACNPEFIIGLNGGRVSFAARTPAEIARAVREYVDHVLTLLAFPVICSAGRFESALSSIVENCRDWCDVSERLEATVQAVFQRVTGQAMDLTIVHSIMVVEPYTWQWCVAATKQAQVSRTN